MKQDNNKGIWVYRNLFETILNSCKEYVDTTEFTSNPDDELLDFCRSNTRKIVGTYTVKDILDLYECFQFKIKEVSNGKHIIDQVIEFMIYSVELELAKLYA